MIVAVLVLLLLTAIAIAAIEHSGAEFAAGGRSRHIARVFYGADAGLLDGLFGAGNALGSQLDENANRNKDTESIQRCGEARLDSTGWNVTAPTPGASNTCLAPAG